jgi:hypothetical protein
MKRVLKWSLVFVGVPSLAGGFLCLDSNRRAENVLDLEGARLKTEIAALRARRRTTSLLGGRELSEKDLDRLPCPRFDREATQTGYELGHTGQDSLSSFRRSEIRRVSRLPSGGPRSARGLIATLAATERCFPEGGFEAYYARRFFDLKALEDVGEFLRQPGVDIPELRQILAALDQILAARPRLEDVLEGEHLLDRAEVLGVIRSHRDGHGMMLVSPGVTNLLSWKVLGVKVLYQLEDLYRELLRSKSESISEWQKKAQERGLAVAREGVYTRSNLCTYAAALLESERQILCRWSFARLAVGIALYQAQHAREPDDLRDLVPEFFPELPMNPYNGQPFEYRSGALRTKGSTSGPQIEWPLRRK